ncbi:hypothetical protein LINPERHAP1_LOCUS24852 [Linum perenne]
MTNVHGQICGGANGFIECSSPMVAEAHALINAVSLALSCPGVIRIFSDCQVITRALDDSLSPWPWECAAILGSIMSLLATNPRISIHFTPRASNKMADWVATSTRNQLISLDWFMMNV